MAFSYSPDIISEIAVEAAGRDDYRRCARRLRAIHVDKPERPQPALLQLAQAMDVRQFNAPRMRGGEIMLPSTCSDSRLARLDSPAAMFAESVSSRLDEGLLRYSERLALFEESDRLGIGRFEANLIIAMVQHRRGATSSPSDVDDLPRYRVLGIRRDIVAFIAIQSAILLGAWWMFA